MKELRYLLRELFDFSHKEIKGFYILSCVLLIFTSIFFVKEQYFEKESFSLTRIDKNVLDSLKQSLLAVKAEKKSFTSYPNKSYSDKNNEKPSKRFPFDPNEISVNEWQSMGLSPYIAKRIENFLQKKGKFRVKSDVQKIYGFPEELYHEIQEFILLPDTLAKKTFPKQTYEANYAEKKYEEKTSSFTRKEITKVIVDINEADSLILCSIKGIGASFSARIIKFRNKLGGFHSIEQLKEVYGMKPEMFEQIAPQVKINAVNIVKININTADKKMLSAHPYIGYKLADVILNYRKQHKAYKNIDDLLKTSLITEVELAKMKPYLSL